MTPRWGGSGSFPGVCRVSPGLSRRCRPGGDAVSARRYHRVPGRQSQTSSPARRPAPIPAVRRSRHPCPRVLDPVRGQGRGRSPPQLPPPGGVQAAPLGTGAEHVLEGVVGDAAEGERPSGRGRRPSSSRRGRRCGRHAVRSWPAHSGTGRDRRCLPARPSVSPWVRPGHTAWSAGRHVHRESPAVQGNDVAAELTSLRYACRAGESPS